MVLGADNPFMSFVKSTLKDVAGDKELKTEGLSLVIEQITGSKPIIDRSNPAKNVIRFTKRQQLAIENFLSKKRITGKDGKTTPSNVEIDHKPLWMPFVIKKAAPYIIGIGAVAFFLGRMTK